MEQVPRLLQSNRRNKIDAQRAVIQDRKLYLCHEREIKGFDPSNFRGL